MNTISNTAVAPVAPPADCFFVTATKDIQTPRRTIRKGNFLAINPNIEPTDGRMVLVDDSVELWAHQAAVRGVVVGVCSDESNGGAS